MKRTVSSAVFALLLLSVLAAPAARAADAPAKAEGSKKPVKIFILAGQSNMQGKGSLDHLSQLVKDEPAKYGHLKDKEGKWVERDDVWVSFPQLGGTANDNNGRLSVGYTWPKKVRVGPELSFGEVVGDAIDEPVFLIKAAWGGQSLDIDFRPPTFGWDREVDLKSHDEWKPGTKGWAYKQIFNQIRRGLEYMETVPELKGRPYEIVGLVWFQGWNDLIDGKRVEAYEKNMAQFIRDIRRDLKTPNLPIVIGVMGQDGDKAAANMQKMRAAQAAPAAMEEFKGTVAAVPTAPYWDPTVKYDGGYHYMGSARFYYGAGEAMGKAMLELLKAAPAAANTKPADAK